MPADPTNLIWIDLEMTGLDPDHDRVIEIATIITSSHLDVIAEGPVLAIGQDDSVLDGMDEWNAEQHAKSGLLERVRRSAHSETHAEQVTLEFIRTHVPSGKSPMCGNSICQDRRFMSRFMPELEGYFHYRHIDVSTLKELCARWAPQISGRFTKNATHRALDDIYESIGELKFYREHLFKLEG